jgi:hypothetical protein
MSRFRVFLFGFSQGKKKKNFLLFPRVKNPHPCGDISKKFAAFGGFGHTTRSPRGIRTIYLDGEGEDVPARIAKGLRFVPPVEVAGEYDLGRGASGRKEF